MAHGVVRTDNMMGTDVRSHLYSVKYMVSTTPTAIDNGSVVKVDGLLTTGSGANLVREREVYKAVTPAANDSIEDIALIASVEVMYDERLKKLSDFQNEADAICRAYKLHSGDVFSVTADVLAGSDMAVGDVVELQAGVKLKVVSSATSGSTTVGEIIAIDVVGPYTYYVIRVA